MHSSESAQILFAESCLHMPRHSLYERDYAFMAMQMFYTAVA
jgi:hypothetical protein